MAQAFGIVSFAGNNIRVGEMQNYRPVGAVSFLGDTELSISQSLI